MSTPTRPASPELLQLRQILKLIEGTALERLLVRSALAGLGRTFAIISSEPVDGPTDRAMAQIRWILAQHRRKQQGQRPHRRG